MKASEVRIGGTYTAKVNNKIVTVRVEGIRTAYAGLTRRDTMYYDVINLTTGRRTMFRSAAKFRRAI